MNNRELIKEFLSTGLVALFLVLLWVSFLLAAGCTDEGALAKTCGTPCYGGPGKYAEQGECHLGTWVCDGDERTCDGWGSPSPEKCDGLDNDCDGDIDEVQPRWGRDILVNSPCPLPVGVCFWSTAVCMDGQWECLNPATYEAVEVSCDGYDNDCDGTIDGNIIGGDSCYTGPGRTWEALPCHRGFYICEGGVTKCINERTPEPEICDGIDNDCNGLTDDVPATPAPLDIVVVADTSTSMIVPLPRVVQALQEVALALPDDARMAVVDAAQIPSCVYLNHNLGDPVTVMAAHNLSANGAALECTLDAQWKICNEGGLSLDWREDSRKVILGFTDEWTQSHDSPPVQPIQAADACATMGVVPFWWVHHQALWEPAVQNAGGAIFDLSHPNLADSIMNSIQSGCGG